MRLFFLRHGIAEDARPGSGDAARALTERGRSQLDVIAVALHRLGIRPATIYSSPLVRCQQTAEIVAHVLGSPITIAPELAPGCSFDQLQRLIRRVAVDHVLIVGHAPDMGDLAARVIGAGDNSIRVKKGGLVCVAYDGALVAGHGTLRYMLLPEQLELLGAAP